MSTTAAEASTETFEEFKERFTVSVMTVAEEYTTSHVRLARRVLDELNIPRPSNTRPPDVPPPVGTVVTHGSPDQREFTVFRYGKRGWRKLYGHFDDIRDAGIVTATDSDADLIAAYKARAWERGQEVKQHAKWCSRYDEVLAEFGIVDPNGLPDFSNWPNLVRGTEARDNLPDGAVLGVSRGDWGIFQKRMGEWVRVCGTRPLAAGTMHLLFDGEGPLRIENANPILDVVPVGSMIRRPGVDRPGVAGAPFLKRVHGSWRRTGALGSISASAFGRPVVLTRFGWNDDEEEDG